MVKDECQLCLGSEADPAIQRVGCSSGISSEESEPNIKVVNVLNQHFWFQVNNFDFT